VRAPSRTTILAILVAGIGSLTAAAAAAEPPDLSVSDLFTSGGHGTRLAAGVTYQASEFPLALRVTPPDGSWAGAQWKANLFSPEEIQQRHLTCSTSPAVCRPPYYGWASVGQGGTSPKIGPRGVIIIMTGYARTPSVAATVESLRTRGRGATYQPTAPVKLAGFSGIQFDGQLVGTSHQFIPFSPPTHKAAAFADAIEVEGTGHAFRFIVLNVRGKTVVVAIAQFSWMSADQYAAFLPKADRILKSLRFPG
jgi:hypothetical protein